VIGRIAKVRKRDGRLVDFDESKIADAVYKTACATGGGDRFLAEELAGVVTLFLEKRYAGAVPGIEEIQDMVEKVLIETGHARMAKAYILYRERRARAREQVSVRGEPDAGPNAPKIPLVGSAARASVGPWSKGRIAEALIREADLDEKVAARIASAVEEKVFSSQVKRITTSAIRSLVEAELFLQGFGDRVGRQALVGMARYDLDRLLRGGATGWRPSGPADLKRRVADAVVAQYAQTEVYSTEIVDAHLDRRIHITDIGAPFEWVAAAASSPPGDDLASWVEAAALLAHRLGGAVTRELTLALRGGAWTREPGAALGAARRLLAHPALPQAPGLRVAFSLAASGEDGLTEALVREHWARFRAGQVHGLPSIVVRFPADRIDSAAGRKALLLMLAAGAETGRIHVVFDRRGGDPELVTPWFSAPAFEVSHEAARGVGGSVAVHVVACLAGGRGGPDSEEALVAELDGALTLALKALRQKRSFMESLMADPGGPLYRVAAGARPLVDPHGGLDLVHLVGVKEAASAVASEPVGVARLAGRLRSYAAVRLAEEGRQMRLSVQLSGTPDEEAAERFFGGEPYQEQDPYPLPPAAAPASVQLLHEAASGTLNLRFARESAPAPEALYETVGLLAGDPRIRSIRLVPWPDRSVRVVAQPSADL